MVQLLSALKDLKRLRRLVAPLSLLTLHPRPLFLRHFILLVRLEVLKRRRLNCLRRMLVAILLRLLEFLRENYLGRTLQLIVGLFDLSK